MKDVEDLSYQEVRGKLKELGLPAKGSSEILRDRLASARTAHSASLVSEAAKFPLQSDDSVRAPVGGDECANPDGRSRKQRKSLSKLAKERKGEFQSAATRGAAEVSDTVRHAAADTSAAVASNWSMARDTVKPASRLVRRSVESVRTQASNAWQQLLGAVPELTSRGFRLGFIMGLLTAILSVLLMHPHVWEDTKVWTAHRCKNALARSSQAGQSLWGYWNDAFPRGRYARGPDGCRPSHRLAALESAYLPDGAHWAPLLADIRSALVPAGAAAKAASRQHLGGAAPSKATGLLLVSDSEDAEMAAMAQYQQQMNGSICASCSRFITREQLAQGAPDNSGAVQATLVDLLRNCPTAAVAVASATDLADAPTALPALINALSEGGHLTADGRPVTTENLVMVITLVAPTEVVATNTDEDAFKSAAKAYLVSILGQSNRSDSSDVRKEAMHAEVLRRRLDFVAPLKLVIEPQRL